MNIRQKYDHWTSSEMQDRLEKLLKQADSLWSYPKSDENIYVYKANSTSAKMRILNRLFDANGKDKSELIFNLKPEE